MHPTFFVILVLFRDNQNTTVGICIRITIPFGNLVLLLTAMGNGKVPMENFINRIILIIGSVSHHLKNQKAWEPMKRNKFSIASYFSLNTTTGNPFFIIY